MSEISSHRRGVPSLHRSLEEYEARALLLQRRVQLREVVAGLEKLALEMLDKRPLVRDILARVSTTLHARNAYAVYIDTRDTNS